MGCFVCLGFVCFKYQATLLLDDQLIHSFYFLDVNIPDIFLGVKILKVQSMCIIWLNPSPMQIQT